MGTDKRCPSCRGRMQRFFAMGIELDRCRACRGVWLESGELTDVLLRELKPQGKSGVSARVCAFCERPMSRVLLPGNVEAETCERCHGVYLDEGELEQLTYGTAEGAPLGAHVSHERRYYFFYCVACGERFPLNESRNGPGGMHCPGCAPSAPPTPPEEEQPVKSVGGWLSRLFGGSDS